MTLPSFEELQTRLCEFNKSGPPIPLSFVEKTVPIITKRYSSGLSVAVILDEIQLAWDQNDDEDNTDGGQKDLRKRRDGPVVTGIIDDFWLASNGETYQAVVRDIAGGSFQWFVTDGYENVLKKGCFLRMIAKMIRGIPRQKRGLDLVLPTNIVALLVNKKDMLGDETVSEVARSMTMKRVWDERDQTPPFVSGKVVSIEHAPVNQWSQINREGVPECGRVVLQDVEEAGQRPKIIWLLTPDFEDFRVIVKVEDTIILKEPIITPTGDSFVMSLSPKSRIYIVSDKYRSKPKSPTSVTKANFSDGDSDRPRKKRRLS